MSTKYDPASIPPEIIFVESVDEALEVFCSIADAENSFEEQDIESGEYVAAYGSEGQVYWFSILGESVSIQPTGEPARPENLKRLLLQYFEACEDPADAHEPLSDLVARAWAIECGYRHRCGSDEEIAQRRMPIWGYFAIVAIPALILFLALRYR